MDSQIMRCNGGMEDRMCASQTLPTVPKCTWIINTSISRPHFIPKSQISFLNSNTLIVHIHFIRHGDKCILIISSRLYNMQESCFCYLTF